MIDTAMRLSSTVLDIAGTGVLGTLLEKIGTVRGAGCDIARSGDSFPVSLVIMLKDESTALLISGSLNLMKKFAAAPPGDLSPSDASAYKSFQSMSITRNHEVLSIKLVMSAQKLLPSAAR
jgi:hypothetical protein